MMTDGAHNTGKFVKPNAQPGDSCDVQAFIAELRKVNKLRKVIINTVCLGSEPNGFERPDASLMQSIATETGAPPAYRKRSSCCLHVMQRTEYGSALRRALSIGLPHRSQIP